MNKCKQTITKQQKGNYNRKKNLNTKKKTLKFMFKS